MRKLEIGSGARRDRATTLCPPRSQHVLLECLKEAGKVLLGYFGRVTNPRRKEAASSVVCDADLAAEKLILRHIRKEFPTHNIIAEESGRIWNGSEYTWVIDPLDGTSNFVAGLPWFGVQIGLLNGNKPVIAAMYLPQERALYFAEGGRGAWRNGRRVQVTRETKTQNVLCAFGFDPTLGRETRAKVELLFRVSGVVRNVRTTNSLLDFCYTVDGRLGGCLNLKTMIWDIVPVSLMLPEAGGRFTNLEGREIEFDLGPRASAREYAVLGGSPVLHQKLLRTLTGK